MAFAGRSSAKESLEDARKIFFGDPNSFVLETNPHITVFGERDVHPRPSRGVLDGVIQKNQEQLAQKRRIAVKEDITIEMTFDVNLFLTRQGRGRPAGFVQILFYVSVPGPATP